MITKLDFILRSSHFCEKYSALLNKKLLHIPTSLLLIDFAIILYSNLFWQVVNTINVIVIDRKTIICIVCQLSLIQLPFGSDFMSVTNWINVIWDCISCEIECREPLTTADVTTANVTTANVNTANVNTVDVTTANVTTADVLVLGYGLWVRVWVMVRVRVWVRP